MDSSDLRLLPCGHLLCAPCVARVELARGQSFKCPNCKKAYRYSFPRAGHSGNSKVVLSAEINAPVPAPAFPHDIIHNIAAAYTARLVAAADAQSEDAADAVADAHEAQRPASLPVSDATRDFLHPLTQSNSTSASASTTAFAEPLVMTSVVDSAPFVAHTLLPWQVRNLPRTLALRSDIAGDAGTVAN